MAENEEKKFSKKMFIIAGVILLLACAGGGYYFMTATENEASEEGKTEDAEAEIEEEEQEEGEQAYYKINQPIIVNFPKSSKAQLIQVSISFLVNGENTVTAMKKHEPMIRNNILMAIASRGADNLMTREGKDELRSEILEQAGEVMKKMTGKNNVVNLFFTSFVMQ